MTTDHSDLPVGQAVTQSLLQRVVVTRAVGLETGLGLETSLETNFLWSRSWSWSRLFCTGLGLGLELLWSWSRSSKIGLETG